MSKNIQKISLKEHNISIGWLQNAIVCINKSGDIERVFKDEKTLHNHLLSKDMSEDESDKLWYKIRDYTRGIRKHKSSVVPIGDKFYINIKKISCKKTMDYIHNYIDQEDVCVKGDIFKKQKGVCNGCSNKYKEKDLTVDHIKPRSHGGDDEIKNLQLLCLHCNSTKNNGTMKDLKVRLIDKGIIKK